MTLPHTRWGRARVHLAATCGSMNFMTKATKKAPVKAASVKAATPKKTAASKESKTTASESADKLGKTGLVEQMSTQTDLNQIQAASVVDAVIGVVVEALKSGKAVGLPGLGTLSVRATAARQGVRPGTSEKIQIAAGKKIAYKVAIDLKKSL